MRRWVRRWWGLCLITFLGLTAVVVGAYFSRDQRNAELWLEVAKSGVQVVAVGVLGGALAAIWHNIGAERDAETERDGKLRAHRGSGRRVPRADARLERASPPIRGESQTVR
jgi:hypothetical protein